MESLSNAPNFDMFAGRVLRRLRRSRGLTVRDVERQSREVFKGSILSGYERGERSISLRRFWELARFYGVPPDWVLAEIAREADPRARSEVVIDLTKLRLVPEPARRSIAEFATQIRMRRGDYFSNVVTLRSGDVEVIAHEMRTSARTVLERLRPALVGESPAGPSKNQPAT
ncbi:MAG TPA: helix-turn-helix domain-containing protein [Actinomycetota bacterium]|jgi:transcriptional regulator with XRE-family HTH domain